MKDFKVKDINQAEFGRKEISIAETEMPGLMTLRREFKDKKPKTKEKDQLIKSYGIGAQIIKSLKIKKMILVTRTLKKVVGLDGYGIKIIKQEIIK